MIFKGELSRYHPAHILMFLSHLGSNGVLSIIHDEQAVTVTLKDGKLVDAHSVRADEKILQIFFFKRFVNNNQLARFNQLKQETGMSVSQILKELKIEMTPAISEVFETGIKEAVLEYFLLENGDFLFTDVVVDVDPKAPSFDCQSISLEIAAQMDEWREIEKNLFSLESRIHPAAAVYNSLDLTAMEQAVIGLAAKGLTIREVIQLMPFSSHKGLKAIESMYGSKLIELHPPVESSTQPSTESIQDVLFIEFKRAFKRMVSADDIFKKLSAVTAFCMNYFEQILIFTARDLRVLECTLLAVKRDGAVERKVIQPPLGCLDQDQAFHAVFRSGIGFFGKVYDSNLLKGLVELPSSGECAIVPIGKQNDIAIMLYVVSSNEQHGLNAFHYLEVLSWLFNPPCEKPHVPVPAAQSSNGIKDAQTADMESITLAAISDPMSRLIEKIDELPPLPSLVFQIIDLLTNPEFGMEKLERIIGQDQSLVAKLIKVSNSVLYGGVGDVGSLREALTRLGTRTVKSLVLTTSTRTFFPKTKSGLGNLSQALWQHSVECGLAAQSVAARVGYSGPEEAFVGGVLHDIGKLVILLKLPEQYRQIQKMSKSEGVSEREMESKLLGFDHAMIGEKLMKKWRMPSHLKDCVQLHHRIRDLDTGDLLIPIVAYGDYLSHAHSTHSDINHVENPADADWLIERLHLTEAQITVLQNELTGNFQSENLFD